ncbi:MAG: GTPase HflX [Pseudomonadota bacterium]
MMETRLPDAASTSRETAYLVHPVSKRSGSGARSRDAFDEARALVRALPALELSGAETAPVDRPDPAVYFGRGKLAEIAERLSDCAARIVVVNASLSPVQQRNLEKDWNVKVLDRTGLILEIFGDRARTREGVLQVELAHLSYQRSRLVRSWTHLERQRGGLGFVGGPGETQIEADRRALDTQIVRLRRQLQDVARTRALHRAGRHKAGYATVSLIGYTNAGKSTLFNRLTGETVLARDMLFATLDPTQRRIELDGGTPVILSDTVGFISNLPTQLISAFRATLEEVRAADVLVHVRDISHPETDAQATSVAEVLDELDLPAPLLDGMIEFRNKTDLLPEPIGMNGGNDERSVAGSAVTGAGIARLLEMVTQAISGQKLREVVHLDFDQGAALAWAHRNGCIEQRKDGPDGIDLSMFWSHSQRRQFHRRFPLPSQDDM